MVPIVHSALIHRQVLVVNYSVRSHYLDDSLFSAALAGDDSGFASLRGFRQSQIRVVDLMELMT
jgi:hypothetical protein